MPFLRVFLATLAWRLRASHASHGGWARQQQQPFFPGSQAGTLLFVGDESSAKPARDECDGCTSAMMQPPTFARAERVRGGASLGENGTKKNAFHRPRRDVNREPVPTAEALSR